MYHVLFNKDEAFSSLNSSLCELGQSPVLFHDFSSYKKIKYAKRNVKMSYNAKKNKVQKILDLHSLQEAKWIEKEDIRNAEKI